MRNGFPEVVVRFLIGAFALSLLGLLSWFAYFASSGGAVFVRLSALDALWLTAMLAGTVCLTSGLLAYHYKFDGYTRGDEVLFRSVLIVSTGILLCSGIWAALIVLF